MIKKIETKLTWQDLVLPKETLTKIKDIEYLLNNHDLETERNLKPNYSPVLFFGSPGIGKTLSACILGNHTDRDVYRVDLSIVISKYIGETEKNLSRLFDKVKDKDWILFFDEADALFGKKTNVQDAHDKYKNLEISYLSERIEDYPRPVISASNFKENIDQAFTRRFVNIIEFRVPTSEK